jgi:hypothetical protein
MTIFNKNKLAELKQKKTLFLVIIGIIVLIIIGSNFMSSHKTTTTKPQKHPDMTGVTNSQFTGDEANSAVAKEEGQIEDVQKAMQTMQKQIDTLTKTITTTSNNNAQNLQALQQKLLAMQEAKLQKQSQEEQHNVLQNPTSITTVSFVYSEKNKPKDPKNYVPPGTFAKAVSLSGADTNAGVNGQSDTQPITLRILDSGTLPNGKHSSLKGCFVTAATYGDASSERGQIRLQRLSCVRNSGHILDIPVEGTISDMGGSDGLRGHLIMRNGKLLWNAGFSGFLSGIGNSMQQASTTQSVSPLGSTSTVDSGKVFQYGAYGGAGTALGKLADYYIKLADLFHPIIQIHAGSNVNVTFLKGFWLDEDVATEEQTAPKVSTEKIPQPNLVIPPTPENLQRLKPIGQFSTDIQGRQVLPDLKNAQLGQTINE